jgi:flavin reductase (DIM6/NTAB) family NADH-FMN oxidoreductase RutF
MTPAHFTPVPLEKADNLMNHGPTVLVSSSHGVVTNVMAAAWACVLDFPPVPKVTVVLDKATRTRELVEGSGHFALQLPTTLMARLTYAVGSESAKDVPDKLERHGVRTFLAPGTDVPLVEGCAGWLVCRVIPEPHNQKTYDLFIGEVIAAWADDRVFRNGRWYFEEAPELRTIHHVAAGNFWATGEVVKG